MVAMASKSQLIIILVIKTGAVWFRWQENLLTIKRPLPFIYSFTLTPVDFFLVFEFGCLILISSVCQCDLISLSGHAKFIRWSPLCEK